MDTSAPNGNPASTPGKRQDLVGWLAGGALFGGVIGYALRPSVVLIGKLPFNVVATRGANLSGVDRILADTAAASFNVTVAGAVLGALIGWGCARMLVMSTATSLIPCRECGKRISREAMTCPGCGAPAPAAPGSSK